MARYSAPGGGGLAAAGPFTLATAPPLVAAFGTPINPGTSAITQGTGGALIFEAAAASGLQARLYPLVGTYSGARRLRVCLTRSAFDVGAGAAGIGIFLRRSANGRAVAMMHRGSEFSWVRWTDPTTAAVTWSVSSFKGNPAWIEIFDDGVNNCTGNYSEEGSYWSTSSTLPDSVTAESYIAFLGAQPDQCGIIGFADNGFGIKAIGAYHHLVTS
jgi:hypothetical protein